MDQVKIGNFISECRKEKGLTQQELADRLGLTAKAVSKWETGKGLPDVSLYEAICKELEITLNEFFAGERIQKHRMVAQTDENLEEILKEYYKMKKQKNIICYVLLGIVAVLSLVLIQIIKILAVGGVIIGFEFFGAKSTVQTDISKYNKAYYIENYGGDLDSNLAVFPDKISNDMEVLNYESFLRTGLFDTDGYILLEYTLDEDAFYEEVNRLSSLEMEIENYDGTTYTNKVMYVDGVYSYPAYVTSDGFDSTYEYALIDEENHRIICVYIAYLPSSEFDYDEYLKKDKTLYEIQDTLNKYTMYHHTFDNGESYVEFDD